MFTKVSERLYLAFIFKMGKKTPAQKIRAVELRQIEKSKRRQAFFITDYIQAKYYNHYHEAACFFNALNIMYPVKPDLRKTPEYRSWRAEMTTGQNVAKPRRTETYQSINIPVHYQPQSPEPQSPQNPEQRQHQSPQRNQETQHESPQRNQETQHESPQSNQETHHQSPEPESPQNSEQHQHQLLWEDNMELKIPLFNYQPSTPRNPEPSVIAQTVETVTEQVLEQSDNLNQLPDANALNDTAYTDINENISRIINELRQDPNLQNIFDDMELCENIEIGEDIRLEQELLNW